LHTLIAFGLSSFTRHSKSTLLQSRASYKQKPFAYTLEQI
jgi:hypothetical protein